MKYKEFMEELLGGRTSGIYLFDSKERYLEESILEGAKSILNTPDFNYTQIKGETDLDTLLTSLTTFPIMDEKKFVIRKGIDLSKDKVKTYSNTLDGLLENYGQVTDFANLFIFSDRPPFKGKFYKKVKGNGRVVEIDRLNNRELQSFIGKRFVRDGKKISKVLVNEIIDRFSYLSKNSEIDLFAVVNTVDKIIANSSEEVVSKKDVTDQLDQILNISIFNLTDALSQRDSGKAMRIYLEMVAGGEDPFMIYHMIIRQVRNLLGIKTLLKTGFSDKAIREKLSLSNFEYNKDKTFVGNFSEEDLLEIHERLFEMEEKMKSQDFDMDLNMLLLVKAFGKGK